MSEKIRLYIDQPLAEGQSLPLSRDHAHYLFSVMRQEVGAKVSVFNGRDGEWRCLVAQGNKRNAVLVCEAQSAPLRMPPDLWLCFAPIKKARTDFIVEKAAEMGAARIMPVLSAYTNSDRVKVDRLQAHAIEAAEQCGGTFVPTVSAPVKFARLLDGWDPARRIMFCDEELAGQSAGLPHTGGPWAIFIGPEGGFSQDERAKLQGLQHAHPVALGPRILRADTAAVAALTVWQQQLGDWG